MHQRSWRPWDRHPPWAHWSFWVIWGIAGTLGPLTLLDSLLIGPHRAWWLGLMSCAIWAIDLALDWMLVRRFQGRDADWRPWQAPRWSH